MGLKLAEVIKNQIVLEQEIRAIEVIDNTAALAGVYKNWDFIVEFLYERFPNLRGKFDINHFCQSLIDTFPKCKESAGASYKADFNQAAAELLSEKIVEVLDSIDDLLIDFEETAAGC